MFECCKRGLADSSAPSAMLARVHELLICVSLYLVVAVLLTLSPPVQNFGKILSAPVCTFECVNEVAV